MTYSEKLKSPKWQKKRLEVLQRDNFSCVLCGDNKTELHINHKKYNGEPWNSDNKDLETLCKDCHLLHHTAKEEIFKVHKVVNEGFIEMIYVNNLGTCCGSLENGIFTKHCGFFFNSKSLSILFELNKNGGK